MKNLILILPAIVLAACASNPSSKGLERAAAVERSFINMEEKLSKTEKELANFQGSLSDLRTEISENKLSPEKSQAMLVLDRLNTRVSEAHADLRALRSDNLAAKKRLDADLDAAARESIQKN